VRERQAEQDYSEEPIRRKVLILTASRETYENLICYRNSFE